MDQLVPFGDIVADRAADCLFADTDAGLTERSAAVHAACTLLTCLVIAEAVLESIIIADSFLEVRFVLFLSFIFLKPFEFSHTAVLLSSECSSFQVHRLSLPLHC